MTDGAPRYGVIIPVYRHAEPLVRVLARLEPLGLPCFLVDDGNERLLAEVLGTPWTLRPWVKILRLPAHSGKGAACMEGSRIAAREGLTHAIFIDADDQHETADIPRVMTLSRGNPKAMILGHPLFDGSAPFKRRFGRIVSNVWVWIETLSFQIKDSLCGFRCLPLAPFLKVAEGSPLSARMDFDPDIVVRLFWLGVPVVNFDTTVRYPAGGVSNFRLGRDNAALFRLHARLFFGMLVRSPRLLARHWTEAA